MFCCCLFNLRLLGTSGGKKYWRSNIWLGGVDLFPQSLGEGQEKIYLGLERVTAFYFRVLKNPPVTPYYK